MPIYATGFNDRGEGTDALLEMIGRGRPAWQRDALCQEYPDVNWFPARGEPLGRAQAICAGCRVNVECRLWAAEQGADLQGIWGGLSARQRKQDRATRPTPATTPVRESILATLGAHPGLTRTAARASVGCGLRAFDHAFHQLVADGAIRNDQPDRVYANGGRIKTRWYLAAGHNVVTNPL